MPAPAKAVDQQVVWKNDEMQTFALALVQHALELLHEGKTQFTTDIVPDAERGEGQGIAGSVVELLKNANVIQGVGHPHGEHWYAMRVKSNRPDRKGAWLCVYQLTGAGIAEEFLRRNEVSFQPIQAEFL